MRRFYRVEIILAEYHEEENGEVEMKRVHKMFPLTGKVHTQKSWAEKEFQKFMGRYSRW